MFALCFAVIKEEVELDHVLVVIVVFSCYFFASDNSSIGIYRYSAEYFQGATVNAECIISSWSILQQNFSKSHSV